MHVRSGAVVTDAVLMNRMRESRGSVRPISTRWRAPDTFVFQTCSQWRLLNCVSAAA